MAEYTINLSTCEVVRVADGKVVAPCQSPLDPDFVAYQLWVEAGGVPTEVG